MRTDSVVRTEGMNALIEKLGKVDAERFISLVLKEPFDYTEWRSALQDNETDLHELSARAMKNINK